MRIYKLYTLVVLFAVLLTSCEHDVRMETTVHEDGSIDKLISYHQKDSKTKTVSMGENTSWKKNRKEKIKGDSSVEVTAEWRKSFASAAEANAELATPNDTLFRVTSTFEKKFRWFYTYIYYADTYHAINRMKLPIDDYITIEDNAFIDRLPAEGKPISKADSLYLIKLNEKLFDIYGTKALFDEYYAINAELIKNNNLERKWLDTLHKYKDHLYMEMERGKEPEEGFALQLLDSLHIPLKHDEMMKQYKLLAKPIESKTNFISTANEGKYMHVITMPWQVMDTNADSVISNQAFWKPPVTKFLIKDYTMYAEARRMNYWAVIVSIAVIVTTVYLFWRRKKMV